MREINPELLQAYQEIYLLTNTACVSCPNEASKLPTRCCDPIACSNTKKWAKLKGIELKETGHPTLPYMAIDNSGCTIDFTLRPLCTMHHCTNCNNDPYYLELKQKIEELEDKDWLIYLGSL